MDLGLQRPYNGGKPMQNPVHETLKERERKIWFRILYKATKFKRTPKRRESTYMCVCVKWKTFDDMH
jgi:hypothetical protein